MIVHLCGMPGVGKLTVAKRLRDLMLARLIDNHLLIDLAQSICDRDKGYIPFLRELTERSYAKLAERNSDEVLLFTNALSAELPEDVARLEAVRGLAVAMGRPFVPVMLACSPEENERRLVTEDRATKRKLRNPEILRGILARSTTAHLPEHPNALFLDTSCLEAAATAQLVAEHCKKCAPGAEK